jgi:hypothetical protein
MLKIVLLENEIIELKTYVFSEINKLCKINMI